MNKYLENLNNQKITIDSTPLLEYAKAYNIPIVKYESLQIILSFILAKKVEKVLEIGTAIGYSAIQMASIKKDLKIDTIEKDLTMYNLAIKNIQTYQLESQIKVWLADAREIDLAVLQKDYDLIFIDAAKAQSQKFFERFKDLLKLNGIIITDNILFHGLVENQEGLTKNVKKMVEKIDAYNKYLATLPDYRTIFLTTGDGLAITMRN